jgi:hypothetical protein
VFYAGMIVSIRSRAKWHALSGSGFSDLFHVLLPSFVPRVFFIGVQSGVPYTVGHLSSVAIISNGLLHISFLTPYSRFPDFTKAMFFDIRDPLKQQS